MGCTALQPRTAEERTAYSIVSNGVGPSSVIQLLEATELEIMAKEEESEQLLVQYAHSEAIPDLCRM